MFWLPSVLSSTVQKFSPEGIALLLDLLVELEVGHQMDVLDPVLVSHCYLVSLSFEQNNFVLPEVVHGDGKVQVQVLHVALVGLQIEEIFVELRVQGVEMVDINIDQSLTQQFGQEERSQRKFHEKIFIQSFTENSPDKIIVR